MKFSRREKQNKTKTKRISQNMHIKNSFEGGNRSNKINIVPVK